MFAQDKNGCYLTWTSIRLGYSPRSKTSLTGFQRPPNHPDCVLDYFNAISHSCYELQVTEMMALMYDPASFFGLPDAEEDDTMLDVP